jgi:hypothetical protein
MWQGVAISRRIDGGVPPLPSVPGVLFLKWRFTMGIDNRIGFGLHAKYTGTAPNNAQCAAAANLLFGLWNTHWLTHQMPGTLTTACSVQDLSSPSAGYGEHLGSTPGTSTGVAPPGNAAVLVNEIIQRRYRGGKPKCYLPVGRADDLTNAQTWSGAAVTGFQTAMDGFKQDILGTAFGTATLQSFVSVSYYQGNSVVIDPVTGRAKNKPILRPGGPITDDVTTFIVSPTPGSQRRRLRPG